MIDRLVHGLAAGTRLDAEEILDVLWLSAAYPVGQSGQTGPDDSAPHSEEAGFQPDESTTAPDVLPLYPESRPQDAGDAAPATAIGFDAPRPLQKVATLPMAVRRLRKVVAPGPRDVVDIDATVDATAEAGRLMLRLTRPPQRALDVALVVDDSPSMRIWRDVFDDLERLLAQTSAFRSVSRWRLAVKEGAIRPHTRHRDDDQVPAAPLQRPGQLVDPSGRRLVLVATDARDRSWYDEEPWDAIQTWCAAMPTVLVHVLPQQYWDNTAVGTPYMTSRALTPAAPNSQYQYRLAWWTADADPGGLPLPVVTLAEKSLDAWAQSIVNGTVWASGITATAPDPGSAPPVHDEVDADVAINDFLAKATPGAQRLARILASTDTPLSMPLISVLRERLAPQTGIAELAEIMASDLLQDIGAVNGAGQPLLRYRDGARAILCRGTSAFEDWDAYAAVGKYLEDRHQAVGPLRILVPDAAGSAELDTADKPFHDFQHALAVRFGLRPNGHDSVAAAVGQQETVPEQPQGTGPAETADDDHVGDDDELRDVLDDVIARLHDGDDAKVAAFEDNGIAVWDVARDENGTPQARQTVLATAFVADPEAFYSERLAPSLGDSLSLVVRGAPDESHAAVFRLLRAARQAPAFDCQGPFADLLREAIGNSRLTRSYDLVVLTEEPGGRLQVSRQPLFQPGAVGGDRAERFHIRCAPTDNSGTVFAVVAYGPGAEPFLTSQLHPVQVQSAPIPPGGYQVAALLSRPGRVRFDGLPGRLSAEQRPLAELIRQVPQRLPSRPPVHLACLIEVSGGDARLRRRVDRLVQLIDVADSGAWDLAVSVISYGPHSVERGVPEDAATVLARAARPERAIRALRGLVVREAPAHEYERAAQTECALDELASLLAERNGRDGRPVVVTVGARPPHPPRVDLQSEIIPCRRRVDWRAVLKRLRQVPTISFGALCDPDAIGEIWRDLGRDAFGRLSRDDVIPGFARDLGLLKDAQVVPFPLLDPGTSAGEREVPRSEAPVKVERPSAATRTFAETRLSMSTVAAQLVALGPPGSGRTTFLSALYIALTRQSYGLRLVGADDASVNLLISMTDALQSHEFPPSTQGIDYFEWKLVGSGSGTTQLTQGGTIEAAKSARGPLQLTLGLADPSGEIVARTVTRYPDRQQLIQHVAGAKGILIMFDPIRELEHRDVFRTIDDFLRRVTWEAEAGTPGSLSRLGHHVAVCVTKFDDPRVLDAADSLNLVTTDRHDRFLFPRVNDSDAREFFARLGGMHGRGDGERLLTLLDQTFHPDRVQFFVTSAVGFYVDPLTDRFDPDDPQNVFTTTSGTRRIRGHVRPINVVEPILWLADRIAGS
jgi:hypothetical protein